MAKKRPKFPVRPSRNALASGQEQPHPRLPVEDDPRPGARFYRAEVARAGRILDAHGGLSPGSVLEVAAAAQAWLTGQVAGVWDRTIAPQVACQEGCAWCCFLPASAWPMELFAIAAWLEERRGPEPLAELRERLRAAVAEADRQRAAAPTRARRLPCPLLADGRCSAYEVRPAACVGWNSADAAPCQAYAEGDDEAHGTVDPFRFFSARAVSEGAAAAVADRGGPTFDGDGNGHGGAVDLAAGLLAVLELGPRKAAAAWLAGSPFLAGARQRMERPAVGALARNE